MMNILANSVFMYPGILIALCVLPLLWYLLRVTPPAPKQVIFPAVLFLQGLYSDDQTPSKTPWWILLLRLVTTALIIVALARPVFNPAEQIGGTGPVRLVLDNSWSAAQTWNLQTAAAEEVLTQASREGHDLYLLTTAPAPGSKQPASFGPLSFHEAIAVLRGLQPEPWPADYKAASVLISKEKRQGGITSLWFSSGLDEGGISSLIQTLQNQGRLHFVIPKASQLPLLLRPAKRSEKDKAQDQSNSVMIAIDGTPEIPDDLPVSVHAVGQNNTILDVQNILLNAPSLPQNVTFEIDPKKINDLSLFRLGSQTGAGGNFLLDAQFRKRHVGIAAPAENAESAPLIEDSYYIKRALEPYGVLSVDTIDNLLNAEPSLIILPDTGSMPSETLNSLQSWVKNGGVLVRFSGPNLAQTAKGEQYLLPVPIVSGERSLSGSLSWAEPQSIAVFEESSPFFGLEIPSDIKIKQQVLADPTQDLSGKVWARLADGTPLITGAPFEKGLLVLIHTTAGPEWSDLALSGLYVQILRRLVNLSGSGVSTNLLSTSHASLEPIAVLDGFGNLIPPQAYVEPLSAKSAERMIPDSSHPPGIYGSGGFQYALNIGNAMPKLVSAPSMPSGVTQSYYELDYELDLMPYVLYTALLLFFIDWFVMILLSVGLSGSFIRLGPPPMLKRLFLVASTFILFFSSSSFANTPEEDSKYADGFYLAYILTGDTTLDSTTQMGLDALADTLRQRTSVEPDGAVGLDPEVDTLVFFPLIYWPISSQQKEISGKGMQNIQNYLDHGGTILFDTREQPGRTSVNDTSHAQKLRNITIPLNIPPLTPISKDHVLGKSFYLLSDFPGRFEGGTLWVEQQSLTGRDGVSSVIVGGNDWAGSWATSGYSTSGHNRGLFGGSRQQEMALRFGVNLVMYSLTGNYKADQVHLPYILKRLDR